MNTIQRVLLVLLTAFIAMPAFAVICVDYQYVGGQYSNRDTNLDLQVSSAASDIVNGVTPTFVSGGFHSATVPGTRAERLATLVDGAWAPNGLTVIAADYGQLVIEWPFGTPQTLYSIVVFAGHDGDGARAFINCKAEVDTGSGYTTLIDEAKTGDYGLSHQSAASSYIRIRDTNKNALVTGCTKLRLTFYDTAHAGGSLFTAPSDGSTVQGTILKEIDVFNTPQTDNITPIPTYTPTNTPEPITITHGGQYAARLQWTNTWASGMDCVLDRFLTRVPVTGGNEIKFGAWVRSATQGMSPMFSMRYAQFQGATWTGDKDQWFTAHDGWQYYSHNLITNATTTTINLAFRLVTTGGGAIVLDDVTLDDVTAGTPIELTNNGFEDWPGEETSAPADWRFSLVGGAVGEVRRLTQPTPTNTPEPTNTPSSNVREFEVYE
ncbi:MAG TPA: hypothetical protein PKH07_02030 [bacterium]|nr:hypothetical protein [bacterium]